MGGSSAFAEEFEPLVPFESPGLAFHVIVFEVGDICSGFSQPEELEVSEGSAFPYLFKVHFKVSLV